MHTTVEQVTRRIVERSRKHREAYLQRVEAARGKGVFRKQLPCSNFAHDLAGCGGGCRTG
jgi:phosphogluconate dehydratase